VEKVDRPEKKEGKDVMSSSFQNWEFRLEKGGGKAWADRINNRKGE
jgi:hypothetical protein